MNKNGEVILVEDDVDDQENFKQAYEELGIKNRLLIFPNGEQAYQYFNNTKKDLFLIICDINMPVMTGIQLRDQMQQVGEVRLRTIPFLFMTTGTAPNNIIYAYSHSVQGFFQKPDSFSALKAVIQNIFNYWASCTEPSFSNRPPNTP